MPAKKSAKKTELKTTSESTAQTIYKVTAKSVKVGGMELFKGWQGPLSKERGQALLEQGSVEVAGVS